MIASVIVPIIEISGINHICMIRRSRYLKKHPGQIGFPGGFIEKNEDLSQILCGQLLLKEEIGINKKSFTLITKLDNQFTHNKIEVVPFIGLIGSKTFRLSKNEVEDLYFFSIQDILNTDKEPISMNNGRKTIRYRIENTIIWGLSAEIIENSLPILNTIRQIVYNGYDIY